MWGTGKPLRQFMYATDLARVIKYFIDNDIVGNYNVAPNWVHSIKEITEIGKKACLKENLVVNYDNTKPDGQFRKSVSCEKMLNNIGDFEFTKLKDGVTKVYNEVIKEYGK